MNFITPALGFIYYFDGENYVKTKSGNKFSAGTKIKVVAPLERGDNIFFMVIHLKIIWHLFK